MGEEQGKSRWFIDLDWYEKNNRSFFAVTRGHLCPKCQKKLKVKDKGVSTNALLSALKGCCSNSTDFIRYGLPVMESIFRILLSNGNEPMELKEIIDRLGQRTGLGTSSLSAQTLERILMNDRHYGLRQVQD